MTRDQSVARFRLIAYALPAAPLAIIIFPAYAILPAFYASHTGIPLATIGTILILSRLFDAIIDPAVGFLSDATRTSWGPRKPWLVLGAVVASISVYALYVPAATVSATYYAGWLMAFFLGFTLIEIPHKAWGTDIVRHYMARSEVSTYLGISFAAGNFAFALVPLFPAFAGHGYDAKTLEAVAFIVIGLLPLTIGLALWLTPQGQPVATRTTTISSLLKSTLSNRPLLHFLLIFVLAGFGQGIFYGCVFLYIESVVKQGANFPYLLVVDALCTLVAVPIWLRVMRHVDKHRAWAIGMALAASAIVAMWWVTAGAQGFRVLLGLIALRAVGAAVIYVAPHATLGDIVDYEILRSHANRAANYHALMALITKANGAVGAGLALILISAVGFSTTRANTLATIIGFKVVVLVLSALILLMASGVAWYFPLDRRRHEIVRRRILSRGVERA
jgi:Na+/melibiose symporter-like transporter